MHLGNFRSLLIFGGLSLSLDALLDLESSLSRLDNVTSGDFMSDGLDELLGRSVAMGTTSGKLSIPGLDDRGSLGSSCGDSLDSSSHGPLGGFVVALGSVPCLDSLLLKSNSVLLTLNGFQKSSVVNGLHFLDKLTCSSSGSEPVSYTHLTLPTIYSV